MFFFPPDALIAVASEEWKRYSGMNPGNGFGGPSSCADNPAAATTIPRIVRGGFIAPAS